MKISIFKSTLLFVASSLLLSSCARSFLEIDPMTEVSTENAIRDVASMRTSIVGTYSRMKPYEYYGRNTIILPDLMSDNVFISSRNSGRLVAFGNYTPIPSESNLRDQWRNMYIAAANASMIIQKGEELTIPESQREEYNQIMGEAYTVRALNYFDLLKMYAQPYHYSSDASHMGVPIVKVLPVSLSELVYPGRSTVKEGYDWIIENLQKAISIMPDRLIINGSTSTKKTRFSKNGAKALLSRVYLYMGQNELAAQFATEVIDSKQYSLLASPSLVSGFKSLNSSESIFELAFDQTNNIGNNIVAALYSQSSYGDALATEELYNLYDAEDVRRGFITKGTRSSAENPAYIVNKYENISTYNEHIKIIRLAEVYLNRAEAYAKSGPAFEAKALEDLNLIRKRANPHAVDLNLTGQALLDEILIERRRELAFEGHRLFDLTRNNRSFTHYLSPNIVDRPNSFLVNYPDRDPNHLKLILPIPQQEIDNNPGLVGQQNEGY